jgi:ribosomal protein L37AE/L43A
MLNLFRQLWQAIAMSGASKADIPDDQCVACDSKDVTVNAPGVYRCNACGYEGGSGQAAAQQAARQAGFDALSDDERRASALVDLREAVTLLESAIVGFDGTSRASAFDIAGMGSMGYAGAGGEGNPKQAEFLSALRLLGEAKQHVVDAEYKLKIGVYSGGEDPTPGVFAWTLDTALDGVVSDILMHTKIEKAKTEAQSALASVQQTLASLR